MKNKKPNLEPVDLTRCQAERQRGSFMSLGPVPYIRCENQAAYVATEKKVDPKYGAKPAMSLCGECLKVFKQQMPKGCAKIEPIKARK